MMMTFSSVCQLEHESTQISNLFTYASLALMYKLGACVHICVCTRVCACERAHMRGNSVKVELSPPHRNTHTNSKAFYRC